MSYQWGLEPQDYKENIAMCFRSMSYQWGLEQEEQKEENKQGFRSMSYQWGLELIAFNFPN